MSLLSQYKENLQYLQNYIDLLEDMDDPSYVARGNGFCDSKFSEDFLNGQMEKYRGVLRALEKEMRAQVTTKAELRSMMRLLKKSHTAAELREMSEKVMHKLENLPVFRKAQNVLLYASLPDEVRTLEFIEKWRSRKQIVLPTVRGDDIIPVALNPDTPFVIGDFNILEPDSTPYTGDFDLFVVPGMAFDLEGNRLGRGKGYYDRFLCQFNNVPTIGVCFDFQIVTCVPTEPTDVRLSKIIH
jgi:5-formyltetrahydrofolate cyclo-ligase